MLSASGLSASYGDVRVLEDVSFSCGAGAVLGVIGPNGAGKSTLLKVLAGLLRPDAGDVLVGGSSTKGVVGYLPQRSEIDWDYPAVLREIVAMGRYPRLGRLRRMGAADRAAVHTAIERVGLTDLAERPINALSGGQQQRAFLARALVQEPSVLLLDEPFAGIDVVSEQLVWAELRAIAAGGTVVVVVHHDLAQIEGSYDRMLLLSRRQVAFGPPRSVLTPALVEAAYGSLPAFLSITPAAQEPES